MRPAQIVERKFLRASALPALERRPRALALPARSRFDLRGSFGCVEVLADDHPQAGRETDLLPPGVGRGATHQARVEPDADRIRGLLHVVNTTTKGAATPWGRPAGWRRPVRSALPCVGRRWT